MQYSKVINFSCLVQNFVYNEYGCSTKCLTAVPTTHASYTGMYKI